MNPDDLPIKDDLKALDDFRSNPPAFLAVSAKRKTR